MKLECTSRTVNYWSGLWLRLLPRYLSEPKNLLPTPSSTVDIDVKTGARENSYSRKYVKRDKVLVAGGYGHFYVTVTGWGNKIFLNF